MTSDSHNLEQRVARAVQEDVAILPYDPRWPALFQEEENRLRSCLPSELIGRIEHFGSTAVPGLAAKPIVDMLVEVTSLEEVKQRVVPILELKGKQVVGDYWRAALRKVPDLAFSIIDVTSGVDAVSIYYRAVMGKMAIETFFFNKEGLVYKAIATYN